MIDTDATTTPDPAAPDRGTASAPGADLGPLLSRALDAVQSARFPLQLDGAEAAADLQREVSSQLRDYLLPRAVGRELPLLVVVGGSTGAGKSTLVNSIVGEEVTPTGVVRPSTRTPVVVCAPEDEALLTGDAVLAGFERLEVGESPQPGRAGVRIVAHDSMTPGMALIDAPDLDSVSDDNRATARRLMAAADFWIFVTTAGRYADAAPWELLRTAAELGTSVAMVLDRVPPKISREVRSHLAALLADAGHSGAPLFTLPELTLQAQLIPASAVEPIRSWLRGLAELPEARARVAERTMSASMSALPDLLGRLARDASAQSAAHRRLAGAVEAEHGQAQQRLAQALGDGRVLHGEVQARWQDFVGSGQFFLGAAPGRGRGADTAEPVDELRRAIHGSLLSTIHESILELHASALVALREEPAGARALEADPEASRRAAGIAAGVEQAVDQWMGESVDTVMASLRERGSEAPSEVSASSIAAVAQLNILCSGTTAEQEGAPAGTAALTASMLETTIGSVSRDGLVSSLRDRLRRLTSQTVTESLAPIGRLLEQIQPTPAQGERLAEAAESLRD